MIKKLLFTFCVVLVTQLQSVEAAFNFPAKRLALDYVKNSAIAERAHLLEVSLVDKENQMSDRLILASMTVCALIFAEEHMRLIQDKCKCLPALAMGESVAKIVQSFNNVLEQDLPSESWEFLAPDKQNELRGWLADKYDLYMHKKAPGTVYEAVQAVFLFHKTVVRELAGRWGFNTDSVRFDAPTRPNESGSVESRVSTALRTQCSQALVQALDHQNEQSSLVPKYGRTAH